MLEVLSIIGISILIILGIMILVVGVICYGVIAMCIFKYWIQCWKEKHKE